MMYLFSGKTKAVAFLSIGIGLACMGYAFFSSPAEKDSPWVSLYISALFSLLTSLGVLVFYAINRVAQASWSVLLLRVMEGIAGYLPIGAVSVALLLLAGVFHWHTLFPWMNPSLVAQDPLLQGKSAYLNTPFFLARTTLYLLGWITYQQVVRKLSLVQDTATDNRPYQRAFRWSAVFLVFVLVSETTMSWDWIMSLDPHWYSTLFAWYLLSSFLTAGVATIIVVVHILKKQGYLEQVGKEHLHDLAKYLFGFSIFWAYLWFSQYMLYWYSNIPEEITYYVVLIEYYSPLLITMLGLNFLLPFLLLMSAKSKQCPYLVGSVAVCVLLGHYIDFYLMVTPFSQAGKQTMLIANVGSVLLFFGAFVYAVFATLSKAPLTPRKHPLQQEDAFSEK